MSQSRKASKVKLEKEVQKIEQPQVHVIVKQEEEKKEERNEEQKYVKRVITEEDIKKEQDNDNQIVSQQEDIEAFNRKNKILKDSGVTQAYEYFLRKLCKDGIPSGNIYEYAAQMVSNFERKKKAAKQTKAIIQKQIENESNHKLKLQYGIQKDLKIQNQQIEEIKKIEPEPVEIIDKSIIVEDPKEQNDQRKKQEMILAMQLLGGFE